MSGNPSSSMGVCAREGERGLLLECQCAMFRMVVY